MQIGGPTGAFVVVVSGIVAQYGLDGLFMCTMMAGVLLVVMGLTGLGTAVRFIPRPVVIGFTNGIALLIASTQIKDFFGITLRDRAGRVHRSGSRSWRRTHARRLPSTTVLAVSVLALILVLERLVPRVPGYIVALVAGTVVVSVRHLPVETIGTRFGGIPAALPAIRVPEFRADLILTLLSPALTVAMLGAIESLMSAVVADRMSGDKPQLERRAGGAGDRQHRVAAGRRPAGHRRDRAHGHQHPLRREDAGRRDDPRPDAARRSCCSPRRWPRPSRWPSWRRS